MTAASPARSDSPWSPPKQEVKKKDKKKDKDKKKKVEKTKEKDKKDKKDKKEKAKKQQRPDTSSDGSPPADRSSRAEQSNMQPSGLLGGDEGAAPSRGRAAEPAHSRRLAERSRSRTELRPNHERMRNAQGLENLAQNVRDAAGEDKGKGKGKGKDGKEGEEAQPKEEPNFEASGLLGMEDNSKNGIVMKFVKPVEARIPLAKWRLYCFSKQSGDGAKVMHIHRKEGYLFGKDRRVADIPTDHPTCSKQHAVLHHRLTADGLAVKPYIMDLESINGTFVNGERIDSARYFELREGDKLKFGMSSREYVLLHAGSANGLAIDPKALESPE